MIGPGGLLLVVPTYLQFQLQFYWWGCPKEKAKLRQLILLSSVTLSTGGDALTVLQELEEFQCHDGANPFGLHMDILDVEFFLFNKVF
jgi:hypothetical protein